MFIAGWRPLLALGAALVFSLGLSGRGMAQSEADYILRMEFLLADAKAAAEACERLSLERIRGRMQGLIRSLEGPQQDFDPRLVDAGLAAEPLTAEQRRRTVERLTTIYLRFPLLNCPPTPPQPPPPQPPVATPRAGSIVPAPPRRTGAVQGTGGDSGDVTRAGDPRTGKKYRWDCTRKQWIDVQTGAIVQRGLEDGMLSPGGDIIPAPPSNQPVQQDVVEPGRARSTSGSYPVGGHDDEMIWDPIGKTWRFEKTGLPVPGGFQGRLVPEPDCPTPPATSPPPETDRRSGMAPSAPGPALASAAAPVSTGPNFELALVFGGHFPARRGFNVTGVNISTTEGGADAAASGVDTRLGGASNASYSLGLRGRAYAYNVLGPQPGWAFFGEVGVDVGFGRSHQQSFQGVNGVQGSGEQTMQNIWAAAMRLGFSIPIGSSPFAGDAGSRNAMLDFYGGLVLNNSRHVLSGSGFYGEVLRSTIDPTIGAGVRVPVTIAGGPAMFLGVNGEVTWRQSSVVQARSASFPNQTFYGTIDPGLDLSVLARLGIAF